MSRTVKPNLDHLLAKIDYFFARNYTGDFFALFILCKEAKKFQNLSNCSFMLEFFLSFYNSGNFSSKISAKLGIFWKYFSLRRIFFAWPSIILIESAGKNYLPWNWFVLTAGCSLTNFLVLLSESAVGWSGPEAADPDEFKVTLEVVVEVVEADGPAEADVADAAAAAFSAANLASRSSFFFWVIWA